MRTLVIDTSTEACSVALFEGDTLTLVDHRHAVLGRGHAERLVPMIAELPGKGRAEAIRVALGPGSFTGLRIGLAAARALAIAWNSDIRGFPSLALTAATAHAQITGPLTVCMNAGHGEWFVQNFDAGLRAEDAALSLAPDAARHAARHAALAGNRACELASLVGGHANALDICPDARCFPALAYAELQADLTLSYGRAPDAKMPQ